MRRFKVVPRANVIEYVEAQDEEEAWKIGKERALQSIQRWGFERSPGSIRELHPTDVEWNEVDDGGHGIR